MVPGHQTPPILASFSVQSSCFFPTPLTEAIFKGFKCPSILESSFFGRFWIFRGSQKRPVKRHFRPLKDFDGLPGERSFSRPGRDLAPKAVQGWILTAFGDVLG